MTDEEYEAACAEYEQDLREGEHPDPWNYLKETA